MQAGDWVLIDYTGRLASDNSIVETTSEEVAKKEDVYYEKASYEPSLVILGKETTLKGIEDALLQMKAGESKQLELAPDVAFGSRDPSLTRVMSVGEFRRRNVDPVPGMMVDLDGHRAMVKSVTSGRVTVDLNHPFAGEKLKYDLKLVEVLSEPEKRAKALLSSSMRIKGHEKASQISINEGVLEVSFSDALSKDMNFMVGKAEFISNALRFMPEVKKIRVVEEYARKE